MGKTWVLLWVLGLTISQQAVSREDPPPCMSGREELTINNVQVIAWKNTTPNQFKARARVRGEVVDVFKDTEEHRHFEIRIGNHRDDVVELVYNEKFGELDEVHVGMVAEACGDYITSNAPTDRYSASPSGAIVHWIHMNPNPRRRKHPHGYLILDGQLFGQDYNRERDSEEIRPRPGPRYFAEDFFKVFF